ncbi:XRE family transcriptional regulator [Maribellus luteus]|uniref:XRE family transcriptional regulator n=1 Tax=Maribellus luteus TaxID=2305463 RepID=A0A399ST77_9BACT|nr:helix-turn-helix transcriptional regulator [Maribellus luteus]MBN2820077.1 helix-turn-helix transcriptional regulator [Bacteroidales bacterium]RIJ47256.1 XRE family transcriptional regulator [Maribellus luteus]
MGNTNNNWIAMSDSTIIAAIGEFVKHKRLQQNKTQAQLAVEAGLNRWTLGQIEKGESVTLSSLIQVLRALNLLHLLDGFTIDETISPIEYARLQEKKRKRAAKKKNTKTDNNEDLGW